MADLMLKPPALPGDRNKDGLGGVRSGESGAIYTH